MKDCIFCKIVNHEAPAHIVYEDEAVMAILDIDPISDGHTLILPKKDILDLHSLDEETGSRVMQVARKLAGVLEKEFGYDGSTIMESNGAFQDVPHFHLHVFGRNKSNDIKLTHPNNSNKDPDELATISARLRMSL